jgi:hypothetical protein
MFHCQNLMWNEPSGLFSSLALLNERLTASIKEANERLAEKVRSFNDRPLEIDPSLTRRTLFEGKEREFLKQIPAEH